WLTLVAVATTPHGHDPRAVGAKFAAKLLDVDVHRPCFHQFPDAPLHQFGTAEDTTRLGDQHGQQPELRLRDNHLPATEPHGEAVGHQDEGGVAALLGVGFRWG